MLQHVATWREGDDQWRYREDSFQHIHTDKVSLDPYRLESRKSLALMKEILPAPPIQRVEKASIDEVFLDLSAHVHQILLERYPALRHAPYDDVSEFLPAAPVTALDWQADGLVDVDEDQNEEDNPDWDDVCINIGAGIVRDVRKTIYEKLKYTCSAGVARNKMMAKLGAGYKKPNQQTIVRNRAVQHFLSGFKFTKIRNLGGKLGDQVAETCNTEEVKDLLAVSQDSFRSKFGDDTGTWIFNIIRGHDNSEVNSRTQIKSMLSAKSFRPSINNFEQAVKWLRIFVSDIHARLLEEGVTENKRRPKTMNLHHRQGGQMRSKQLPISSGKKIDWDMLFELAKTLLQQVIAEGRAWPCANLSLSVGGFEDGVTGNMAIGNFLVRGDEAKALESMARSNTATPVPEDERPSKRRKTDENRTIGRFFKTESTGEEAGYSSEIADATDTLIEPDGTAPLQQLTHQRQADIATYFCGDCKQQIPEAEKAEHNDWHFAKSLQSADQTTQPSSRNSRPSGTTQPSKRGGGSNSRGRGGKQEKGQSRLAFG